MPARQSVAYMPQSPSNPHHTHQPSLHPYDKRSSTISSDCSSTLVDYGIDIHTPAARDYGLEKSTARRKRKSVAFVAEDEEIVLSSVGTKHAAAPAHRHHHQHGHDHGSAVNAHDEDSFTDKRHVQHDSKYADPFTHQHVRCPPIRASPGGHVQPISIPVSPPGYDNIPAPHPSPSRKRRFSIVSPPLIVQQVYTSPDPFVGGQELPSPRKRRFSIVQPEGLDKTGVIPTHTPIKVPRSPPRVKGSRGYNGEPPQRAPVPSDDTYTHTSASAGAFSKEACQEINRKVHFELGIPDFDFARHIRNRSYVIRSHRFGGGPHRSVTMLDSYVNAMLPSEPLLGLVGIDGLGPQATSDSHLALKNEKPQFTPKFELAKAKGKGLGMFATAHIDIGERILVEHPAVVTPYVIGLKVPLDELYADIFGRLSEGSYHEVMALPTDVDCNHRPNLGRGVYEAIMRLNSLAIQLASPDDDNAELSAHRALFINGTRFNHSCGPNARYEWDAELFALIITAVRPIQPDEEICIPYVPSELPSGPRAAALRRTYGFECCCSFCTRPEEDIVRADLARTILTNFWGPPSTLGSASQIGRGRTPHPSSPTFSQWASDLSIPADLLPKAHLHALHLIAREGLEILDVGQKSHSARDVGRHIDGLSMCYGALEDVARFREWTRRADEAREKSTRYEMRADRVAFSKWLSNPASFPVWGLRKAAEDGRDGSATADRRRFSNLEGF
ncbi:hypothetical protein BJ165DRAFT_1409566 [Panaeolus papilionaceus]|nr:hypothetical protein BJ165DRAFT_1409566 [Panaeolus papilionaceus]